MASRFATDQFSGNQQPTIGAAYLTKIITIDGKTIKFEIWDTAGQERFNSLVSLYYRNASAAIVAYDITKMNSFNIAKAWVNKLQRQTGVVIALGQFPMNNLEKVYSDPIILKSVFK